MQIEFNGEEYRKASVHQKEWGDRLVSSLQLKGDEKILDLGCGDGVVTAKLAERVPRGLVLGIDSSRSMIDTAQKIQIHNLKFENKDINNLDYENEFDLIFSNAALHWVLNHPALLNHSYNGLKKGGLLRINFAAAGNCATFIKIVREVIDIPQFRRYFYNYQWPWYMPEVEEYRILVQQYPFTSIEVWGEKADRHFSDADSITRWIDQPSLVPFKSILQPPGRGIFRDMVVQRMLEATRQPDGTYFETFRRINVAARK
jgi:trans-aconitate 2-methyltransferase